jgi:ferredoxin-NADP reductase
MQKMRSHLGVIRDLIKNFYKLFTPHFLTLKEIRNEGENIKTFIFTSDKKVKYDAGQYGVWFQKRWIFGKPWRLFSLASSPDEDTIQLSTHISNSDFKQKLNKTKIGNRILMFGAVGEFTLPKKMPKKVVFITGGIGITPIRSLVKNINKLSLPIKTTLIRSGREFYLYKNELEKLVNWAYYTTRDDFENILNQVIKQNKDAIFYLSGTPQFVESTRILLINKNINHIKIDSFLGY